MIFIPSLCATKLSSFIIGWGPVTSFHRFIIIYPRFYCKVDMKCMVSYIQWYHEMKNGKKRRKKIQIFYGDEMDLSKCFRKCETAEDRCQCWDALQIQCLQGIYPALFSKTFTDCLTALSPHKVLSKDYPGSQNYPYYRKDEERFGTKILSPRPNVFVFIRYGISGTKLMQVIA